MATKTKPRNAHERHLANADNKRHIWTESEILALRMSIHRSNGDNAKALIAAVNDGGGYRITQEQSDKGINYLRSRIWTERGMIRNSKFSRCFGNRERAIISGFKKFTFVGVRYTEN